MKAVVVGAGAIGVAYAWHLAAGGAAVTFLVREKYVSSLRDGIDVVPPGARGASQRFTTYDVSATSSVCSDADLVVLAIPSTGYNEEQIRELHHASPAAAIVLSLLPQAADHRLVAEQMAGRVVLAGMLAICAYASPLPGSEAPSGQAWWFPPLAKCLVGGENLAATRAVVGALRAGGLPAGVARGIPRSDGGNALLLILVAGLSISGWRFAGLIRSPQRETVRRAAVEASSLAKRRANGSELLASLLFTRFGLWLLWRAAALVVPFDFERFLEVHFTKVSQQSLANLQQWVTEADEASTRVPGIRAIEAHYSRSLAT